MSSSSPPPAVTELGASEAPFGSATLKVVQRARHTFYEKGYRAVTMTLIAENCGLTRRGLYHHFRSKEEVFRAGMALGNHEALQAGDWAAHSTMSRGGSALDVVAQWLDTRFGEIRRAVMTSPHGAELNEFAFRLGADIMIAVSHTSNARLTAIIAELNRRGLLALKPGHGAQDVATLIADGARGVNQERPPVPAGQIAARYRRMAGAILYGCAWEEKQP